MEYPKRLIEVDLPIKRISEHARNEKDSRCGHIPRLHIYPAARPLAACRAVLCASLWLDPVDELCPDAFRIGAQNLMLEWAKKHTNLLTSPDSLNRFMQIQKDPKKLKNNIFLRQTLLDFISDFANWDNSRTKEYIETSQSLTKIAHISLGGVRGSKPVIVDPFAGGGAIPLEGLRIGADVFASDSNPLSVLINKVILQYAPIYGERLNQSILNWGQEVNKEAKKDLGKYYPIESTGQIPIAYLWARTVLSEAPDTNKEPIEVPLIRSMWLSRKGTLVALRWKRTKNDVVQTESLDVEYSNGKKLRVRRPILEIFQPKSPSEVGKGTVARNSVTCPVTGFTTPAKSVQAQLMKRQGGGLDARLYCVVSVIQGQDGRHYSIPSNLQIDAYKKALIDFRHSKQRHEDGYSLFPNEYLPAMSGVFNAPLYGHNTWGSLFNARQILALSTYVRIARKTILTEMADDSEYGIALAAVLGLVIDRLADLNATLCVWQLSTPNTAHVFGRWALPMIMDYGEVNPLAGAGGSPQSAVWRIGAALKDIAMAIKQQGEVSLCSADTHLLPDDSADAFITDPPYYNAVPYADISDFFYVWLRRTIGKLFPDLFNGELSPKDVEICEMAGWDPERYKHKDKVFFEQKMTESFCRAREYLKPTGIGVVVFAHKSTSGWEALIQALIDANLIIVASWPIDTEMASRLRAKNSATLASSIHLVCRPRENPDGSVSTDDVGDWRDVLAELPKRIHDWMPRLADEGVVGADAIFACLGPALEIFSRYSRVEKASGEKVTLKEYLEQVWAVVAKEALNMIFEGADTSNFEEDARLTAMWLWTLSTGVANGDGAVADDEEEENDGEKTSKAKLSGYTLEYDAARKIAQGLGANLEHLQNLVEVKGDKARLLPVSERTKALFGKDESESPVSNRKKKSSQLELGFMEEVEKAEQEGSWGQKNVPHLGNTTLDRIHQSMILFAANRSEALKRFLVEEGVGRDQKFWKLAQALSALYPSISDEKRWVDGVLARKKGLGF
ncbi:MAG TPA: DUF1156 domain-containing protein [Smithellaceae bacterium]|nr:DUF1156 domain-containing protein [Smithellaceae bacterium]